MWLVSGSPAAALSMRSQAVSGHRSLGSCFTVLQHTTTRHQSSTFSGGKEGACLVFSFQVALSRMDYTVKLLIRNIFNCYGVIGYVPWSGGTMYLAEVEISK